MNTKKIATYAVIGAVAGLVGRKYVWPRSARLFDRVMPGYARWMRECSPVEAALVGAAAQTAVAVVEELVLDQS